MVNKKNELKKRVYLDELTQDDYTRLLPLLIKSTGLTFVKFSRMAGKSDKWLTEKLSRNGKLSLVDFKLFEVYFKEKFPHINFKNYINNVIKDNIITESKISLLKKIESLKKEI